MLPTLATFATKPSWHNRAGRTDRSACVELKASDLWRRIPQRDWQLRSSRSLIHSGGGGGGDKIFRGRLLTEAWADVTFYDLSYLHDGRRPYAHKGDFRTQKSNALKPADEKKFPRSPWLTPANARRAIDPNHTARGMGIANPNKGASCSKVFGLPNNWSQTLTLQRWRLHDKLAQHFFACPHCKQRALKLFLPLCTQAELRDAGFARLWLVSHHARIVRYSTLRADADRLALRYSPLFPSRRMLCRKCLNLRYGDVRRPKQNPYTYTAGPTCPPARSHFDQPLRGRKVYYRPLLAFTRRSRGRRHQV